MKAESGTCNVCAAPCSSCGHLDQTVSSLEIKAENELSDEVSRVTSPSRSSFDDASVMPSVTKRARFVKEPATSETSNYSASSTHDHVTENAESEASLGTNGAVETLPKFLLGGVIASDQNINVSSDCDVAFGVQRTGEKQHENGCTSENVSCVSGVNDTHTSLRDLEVDVDRKNISCSTASVSSFRPNNFEKMGHVQSDPEGSPGARCERKTKCNISGGANMFLEELEQKDSPIYKSNSLNQADSKELGEKFCSQLQVESSVCFVQHVESSSEKLEKNIIAQQAHAHESGDAANKCRLMCSSYGTSAEDNSCLGVGTVGTAKAAAKSVEHLETNEQIEQPSVPPANNEDPPSQSQRIDESEVSDIVEDDVKVCDICGDAGREDLLAICSRCSDGAEHTYCMRIPMKKVPEADWLCEVCHLKEKAANQKKDKFDTVSGTVKASIINETMKRSVVTLDSKVSPKSNTQFSDEEANRFTKVAPSPCISLKRNCDNLEAAPAAKRQALESISGSPKPSSPNKTNMLSREISFKNMDKGKVKQAHPVPSSGGSSSQNTGRPSSMSVQNSTKLHPPLQSPRGHLVKSNSFNTSNLKPKVKLAHEDMLQKNKLGKQSSTSGSRKESLVRSISKSSSFNIGSSYSATVESKPKMNSSNRTRSEDLRGTKVGKEPNIVESKTSFKSDRLVSPTIGSSVSCSKDEQKVSSRGEAVSAPSSTTKICDMKSIQADVRLSSSLKSTAGRSDLKRLPSFVSRVSRYSSLNGNHAEQKPSQVNRVDDSATNLSCTVEASNSVPNLVPQDGLPQSQECIELDKKGEEPSFIMSRPSVQAAGRTIRCNKCKEIGHTAQFCPNGSMRVIVREPTAVRSSKEMTNRSTKWKDTNEVTFLESSKKTGLPVQSDELPIPSAENQTPGRGIYPAEAIDLNDIVSLEGHQFTPSSPDMQNQDLPVSLSSRISPIPEPDYIWQGRFDVQRSERSMDFFDGVQAHLSTCASPKVLEVVNKLPYNVMLEEVSRSSTWPKQFQNCATEDNIALYFFPKDVESYVKCYQNLVENMMKNDLALKGLLNGIELLIFPSNQLSEKSKRWNMLSFLWGVFRAKRMNVTEKPDVSLKPQSVEKSLSMLSATQLPTDIKGNGTSALGHGYPKIKEETELGQCKQEVGENICPTEVKTPHLDNSNCSAAVLPSPSLQRQEACSGPLKLYPDESSSVSHNSPTVPGGVIMTERYFFPVESCPPKDSGAASSLIPVHVISSDDEEQVEPGRFDLNLALGEEDEEESPNRRNEPLFECFRGKENNHGKGPVIRMNDLNNEEDASLGSLSLSLAAPTSSSLPIAKPKPQKSQINTPLLLFGGFPDA